MSALATEQAGEGQQAEQAEERRIAYKVPGRTPNGKSMGRINSTFDEVHYVNGTVAYVCTRCGREWAKAISALSHQQAHSESAQARAMRGRGAPSNWHNRRKAQDGSAIQVFDTEELEKVIAVLRNALRFARDSETYTEQIALAEERARQAEERERDALKKLAKLKRLIEL